MELPIALDTAIKALLGCHSVYSWKITAEGPNPTVILRLRPETEPSVRRSGERIDTVAYRRKPPCQIQRDKRRAEEYRQRRESSEDVAVTESSRSENAVGHEKNKEIIDEAPKENQSERGDSVYSVGLPSPDTTQHRVQHVEARLEATETATRDEGESHGSDMETDTKSDTETTHLETECKQSTIDFATDIVKNAKSLRFMPDNLKQEDRNKTFEKVVIDYRCRGCPVLVGISDDVIARCDLETRQTLDFQLRNHEDGLLGFWHFWPKIDQDGNDHKEIIDKKRIEMNEVLRQVRKMIKTSPSHTKTTT